MLPLLFLTTVNAQKVHEPNKKVKEIFTEALRAFASGNYTRAQSYCEEILDKDPLYVDPYKLMGNMYHEQKKFDKERAIYKEYLAIDSTNYEIYVNLAKVDFEQGYYDDAEKSYIKLLNLPGTIPRFQDLSKAQLKQISFIKEMMLHPVSFQPINAGSSVNSTLDEYMPAFTVDGSMLYFTRRKVVAGYNNSFMRYNEDIMYCEKQGDLWSPAKDLPGLLNTDENEGAVSIAPDGSFMVFTGCNWKGGYGSCDLYISFLMDGKWSKPANIGGPVNTNSKETQPSISFDGKSIYFSSDRPGGYGFLDLYVTTRDDNWNFSKPINLGPVINTKEDEQMPFIHPDNKTLYFCSNGHKGMGKNDIFYARKKLNSTWDSVMNMGYPINTSADEPGLIVDREGQFAYYSSNNSKSLGGIDIFYFKLPESARPQRVTYLKGKVFDASTKTTLAAHMEIIDLETGDTIVKIRTEKAGKFLIALPEGKDYLLNVSCSGYLFYSDNLNLKDYKEVAPYEKDIPLQPIKKDEKITLKNINFDTDKYSFKKESSIELSILLKFLNLNPKVKIEIGGHTDTIGTLSHNEELSRNRAKAVYDYLIKNGIAPTRLTFKGYGSTQPIADNNTEEGRNLNRRTEVKVVE